MIFTRNLVKLQNFVHLKFILGSNLARNSALQKENLHNKTLWTERGGNPKIRIYAHPGAGFLSEKNCQLNGTLFLFWHDGGRFREGVAVPLLDENFCMFRSFRASSQGGGSFPRQ